MAQPGTAAVSNRNRELTASRKGISVQIRASALAAKQCSKSSNPTVGQTMPTEGALFFNRLIELVLLPYLCHKESLSGSLPPYFCFVTTFLIFLPQRILKCCCPEALSVGIWRFVYHTFFLHIRVLVRFS